MGEHDYYMRLVEILKQNGCYPTRTGKGSHERWFNPKNKVPFTVHKSCKSRFSAQKILNDAGIDIKI